jgi:hypothetical protein
MQWEIRWKNIKYYAHYQGSSGNFVIKQAEGDVIFQHMSTSNLNNHSLERKVIWDFLVIHDTIN